MSGAAVTTSVESLIARCLLDAAFLRDARADPARALAERNLGPEALPVLAAIDLSRVRQFAGFITKVQHNHLWESMPYTRSLMKHYGAEIEIFATFHGRHLDLRASHAPRTERLDAFGDFVDAYAAARDDVPGLRDILRHERIQMELRAQMSSMSGAVDPLTTSAPDAAGRPTRYASLVPAVLGALRVASFEHDPLAIAAAVSRGDLPDGVLSAPPNTLAYAARPAARQLRVLEIDALTAALLVQVNGRRSIRAIAARVTGRAAPAVPVSRLRPIFDAARDAGLITLQSRPGDT
jgi:hypothetical protein